MENRKPNHSRQLPRRALLKGAAIAAAGLAAGGTYRLAQGAEAPEPKISVSSSPNTGSLSQEAMVSEVREMVAGITKDVKNIISILERRNLEHTPTDWWAS